MDRPLTIGDVMSHLPLKAERRENMYMFCGFTRGKSGENVRVVFTARLPMPSTPHPGP